MGSSTDSMQAFEAGKKAGLGNLPCVSPTLPRALRQSWEDGWAHGAYERTRLPGPPK